MRSATRLAAALVAAAALATVPAVSAASVVQPVPVSEDPADFTPQLVYDGAGAKPHVDAIAQGGATLYAGGLFDSVKRGAKTFLRHNLMAFNATTGRMQDGFAPDVHGAVWAIEATTDAVYVGGSFDTVDGIARPVLVKLNLDGSVDETFQPRFSGGRIDEIKLVDGRLLVGGKSGKKLVALDPDTGKDTGYIDLGISAPIDGAWGGVAIYQFDVSPDGQHLVATGNFETVAGQPRTRFFMLDLGSRSATLSPWYYDGFAKPCSSTNSRRIAYLQGVDYSPDGKYFVVTATGQVSFKADLDVTVCDAAARFNVDDPSRAQWINYTGGDSVWAAESTGSAVYVQGHFQWLDNRDGYASMCTGNKDLTPCASRKGVGAIDPATGKALSWNPGKPAQIGGKDFLATLAGLWIGSDSDKINGELHRGLAFMPLP